MALNEQQLISKIEELKRSYAVDALSGGSSGYDKSFEFGRHVGFIEGVNKAQQLLTELLHGDDNKHERKPQRSTNAYTA